MIKPARETLESRAVKRSRPSPANIAADDFDFLTDEAERPEEIGDRKAAIFPIGGGFGRGEAIEINGDVDFFSGNAGHPLRKFQLPVVRGDGMNPIGIIGTGFRPRLDAETILSGRATIPKKAPGPFAFIVATTPDGDFFDPRIFEGTIDPGATRPIRRTDVPIGMIIEG